MAREKIGGKESEKIGMRFAKTDELCFRSGMTPVLSEPTYWRKFQN